MDQHKEASFHDLALYKMQRAFEDLESAVVLLNANQYRAANNRSYYAVFHAIDAVLALEPVAFKKHKDTLAYFNKNYVHTGLFPAEFGRIISRLEVIRHRSDYDDFYIVSKSEAALQIQSSAEILNAIQNYISTEQHHA